MDDQLHTPGTAVARERDAGAPDRSWAGHRWALHLPGRLTTEQQDQLVAEHNSWSLAGDHQRPTVPLGGWSEARRARGSADETVDRRNSVLPEWLVEIGCEAVTFHVGDTVVRGVSFPSRPGQAVAELVLRTGGVTLVALTQSGDTTTGAHSGTAGPSTGLLGQHLTVTVWTSR
jgi:hypothetical protein